MTNFWKKFFIKYLKNNKIYILFKRDFQDYDSLDYRQRNNAPLQLSDFLEVVDPINALGRGIGDKFWNFWNDVQVDFVRTCRMEMDTNKFHNHGTV